MGSRRLRMQMMAALFAGITAACAQIAFPVPFSPVPFTGQTLAVALAATILGARYGALSMLIYTLMGAVGMRVFAEFSGGLHVLVGPTGGFIFGFILGAYVTGKMIELHRNPGFLWAVFANAVGLVIIFAAGTAQLKFVADLGWREAALAGVVPFIPTGVLKVVLASAVGIVVRRRLQHMGVLHQPVRQKTA
jgi:biotin transport system substrate-specific component